MKTPIDACVRVNRKRNGAYVEVFNGPVGALLQYHAALGRVLRMLGRSESEPLTFASLREANTARLPLSRNAHGEKAHSEADGSDWSDAEWLQAVLGELGEYANLRKKVQRGDIGRAEAQPMLADELADVAIYLDLLAYRLGVDLGAAIVSKFNRVSDRVGCDVKLADEAINYSDYRLMASAESEESLLMCLRACTSLTHEQVAEALSLEPGRTRLYSEGLIHRTADGWEVWRRTEGGAQ